MKNILPIFLLLTCGVCFGQNLVPNPSFEVIETCPFSANEVDKAIGWHTSRESPDYYNICNTYTVGIPSNFTGYQYAHTGVAYMGFIAFTRNQINGREHFACQLTSPLIIGTKYFISFYLSHANNFYGLSCNKIGLLFSTVNYNLSTPSPVNNSSQFYTDSIITDTLNWVLVHGSFIADSNYTKLTVGGFFVDSLTDTIYHLPPGASHSYYLIDDICVSTDSLTCNTTVGIQPTTQSESSRLFPNPFSTQLTFSLADNEQTTVLLYNFLGQQVLQQTFTNSTTINTEQLADGIYFYELRNSKGTLKTGKVVKQ